jgi:hypothetical protein
MVHFGKKINYIEIELEKSQISLNLKRSNLLNQIVEGTNSMLIFF